jgi:hypothetical protein
MIQVKVRRLSPMMCLKKPETTYTITTNTFGIALKQFQTIARSLNGEDVMVWRHQIHIAIKRLTTMLTAFNTNLIN